MSTRPTLLSLAIAGLAVIAVVGWSKYMSLKDDYATATERLGAYDRLRAASENFTAARFVRATSTTEFVFATPVQFVRDRQTFVDYIEQSGTLVTDQIYRANNPDGSTLQLGDISPGQDIRLDMRQTSDVPPRFLVDAIYIIE